MLIFIIELISLFIIPIVEIIIGKMKAKKEINKFIGYRSAKTMSSQEMWEIGQQLMKKYMSKAGIISLVIGIIGAIPCFFVNEVAVGIIVTVVVLIQTAILLILVVKMDKEMKAK